MIISFTITNYRGESIVLDLANPYDTGLAIQSVKGLQPVKTDINTTDIATMDGVLFNSARAKNRNIVFKFKYLEAPTIEESRERCYKYFPIKKKVKIVIHTDLKDLYTVGYVESNEADIFSNKSSTQVSIVCPESYFRSLNTITTELTGIEKIFDFPLTDYSDDAHVKNITSEHIEFGLIGEKRELKLLYEGEVDNGYNLNIHFLGPCGNIIINDLTTGGQFTIYTEYLKTYLGIDGISIGDDIYISTIKGNKYVYFKRDTNVYNIMSCIDINSDWFQLQKGYNRFSINTDTGYENIVMNFTNDLLFEGV